MNILESGSLSSNGGSNHVTSWLLLRSSHMTFKQLLKSPYSTVINRQKSLWDGLKKDPRISDLDALVIHARVCEPSLLHFGVADPSGLPKYRHWLILKGFRLSTSVTF